ncbi:MAG: LysM peptidoglycan-binding domain-containing protein [Ardenticatenaceae bacterium]|nr:LysM peptidoglycan-binding domain-containing protein [Ardenticatenaceae bacterium]
MFRQRPSGVKRGALLTGLLLAVALLAGCGDTHAGPSPAGPRPSQAGATRTPRISAPRTPVPPSPTQAATATTAPSEVYTVQRGDTLNAIAAHFGVTVACLVAANQITNPDLIRPGQPIAIPPCDARTQPIRGALEPTRPAAEQAPAAVPQPTAPPPAANCDPSYPDVCIPPPPPDLDCGEILYRRFRVLPPDPHRFDGDHDGIGCER